MSKKQRNQQRNPVTAPAAVVKRSRVIPITAIVIILVAGGLVAAEAVRRSRATSVASEQATTANKSCCDKIPSRFASLVASTQTAKAGMVWIPGGEFTMGTDAPDVYPQERPSHRVKVSGFWMDETAVTNAQFEKFIKATGYVTTAEKAPDWEEMKKQVPPGTPKPPAEVLVAASLVFVPTGRPVPTDDVSQWWAWTPQANWRHPEGPNSNITGREEHPVVQVSWDDAAAYAKWAGKRLPTEAEWEYAARGGLEGKRYFWGDDELSESHPQCNTWQGTFPANNTLKDGFDRTSPVKQFHANGYGLYDMAGNVWQWCADWYRYDAYQQLPANITLTDPIGPEKSFDPDEPFAPKRVTRGGSFLCNASYCSSYRITARRGTSADTSMSHIGFRCAESPAAATK